MPDGGKRGCARGSRPTGSTAPPPRLPARLGLDDETIARPMIGVVSQKGETTPCNMTGRFAIYSLAEIPLRSFAWRPEEYFQLYSHVHRDGFFFEIVERRGGYRGYGAPDAPFRLAAQKRELPPKELPRQ